MSCPAVIGGIISELNGGSFSHGAIIAAASAAASMGLNELAKNAQNNRCKCRNILIKRIPIDLSKKEYGYWLTELLSFDESYGWWPSRRVGIFDTIFGVKGDMNGMIGDFNEKGISTQDPYHGKYAEGMVSFNPTASTCAACNAAETCIRNFANSYSGNWSWPFGQNCHSFQRSMMEACGLQE